MCVVSPQIQLYVSASAPAHENLNEAASAATLKRLFQASNCGKYITSSSEWQKVLEDTILVLYSDLHSYFHLYVSQRN
jgi:hypothetical protein